MSNSWDQIGISASLVQSYTQDQYGFLPMLAGLFEAAMPEIVTIERKPVRLFSKDKKVVRITVHMGEDVYTLADPGVGGLVAEHVKVVRGIALKTDVIGLDQWLELIGAEISRRAAMSERASLALSSFLELGK
jgi:hypothetical protein